MRHLHPEELIDLADGARAEASAPHLQTCEGCRRQLAELRAVMRAAAQVDVPEPSPLFWDHFSARVRDAVAVGGPPRRAPWLGLSAAVCAAVIIAVVTLRVGHAPGVAAPSAPAASLAPAERDVADADLAAFPDDPSLDLVADLAAQVDWDAAGAPGFDTPLETHEDAADNAVGQLTAVERGELQRLLKQELTRPGA
jgi:hypothetical protein